MKVALLSVSARVFIAGGALILLSACANWFVADLPKGKNLMKPEPIIEPITRQNFNFQYFTRPGTSIPHAANSSRSHDAQTTARQELVVERGRGVERLLKEWFMSEPIDSFIQFFEAVAARQQLWDSENGQDWFDVRYNILFNYPQFRHKIWFTDGIYGHFGWHDRGYRKLGDRYEFEFFHLYGKESITPAISLFGTGVLEKFADRVEFKPLGYRWHLALATDGNDRITNINATLRTDFAVPRYPMRGDRYDAPLANRLLEPEPIREPITRKNFSFRYFTLPETPVAHLVSIPKDQNVSALDRLSMRAAFVLERGKAVENLLKKLFLGERADLFVEFFQATAARQQLWDHKDKKVLDALGAKLVQDLSEDPKRPHPLFVASLRSVSLEYGHYNWDERAYDKDDDVYRFQFRHDYAKESITPGMYLGLGVVSKHWEYFTFHRPEYEWTLALKTDSDERITDITVKLDAWLEGDFPDPSRDPFN